MTKMSVSLGLVMALAGALNAQPGIDRFAGADQDEWRRRFVAARDAETAGGAATALREFAATSPALVEAARGWIRDRAFGHRHFAVEILAGARGPVASELGELVLAGDAAVREAAFRALAELGPAAANAAPKLLAWLSSARPEDPGFAAAASALGAIGTAHHDVASGLVKRVAAEQDAVPALSSALALVGNAAVVEILSALDAERRRGPLLDALVEVVERNHDAEATRRGLAVLGIEDRDLRRRLLRVLANRDAALVAAYFAEVEHHEPTLYARKWPILGLPAGSAGSVARILDRAEGQFASVVLGCVVAAEPDAAFVPALARAAASPDDTVRWLAARGLAVHGPLDAKRAEAALAGMLGDTAPLVLESVIEAYETLARAAPEPDRGLAARLREMAGDHRRAARGAALALVAIAPDDDERRRRIPAAVSGDEDDLVRTTLAVLRRRPLPDPAVPALAAGAARVAAVALGADMPAPRRASALRDLAEYGTNAASVLPGLVRLLDDPDIEVRRAAIDLFATSGTTGRPALDRLLALARAEAGAERARCVRALGGLREAAAPALPFLVACLDDPEQDVQRQAGAALWKIGPAAVDALRAVFASAGPGPHRFDGPGFAAEGARHRGAAAGPLLEEFARDREPLCRARALVALAHVAELAELARATFRRAVTDEDWRVRRAAAELWDARTAAPPIPNGLFTDPDGAVRRAARELLARRQRASR